MRIVLTNLSNKLYAESRSQLNNSAIRFGITEINSYDFDEIKQSPFYSVNKGILDQPKGIGYWLWKPYIILKSFSSLKEGDIVIYSDCGIEIINSLAPLIEICRAGNPVLLFANGNFTNKLWTKRDCFVLMDCDNEEIWNARHCDAAFLLFMKTPQSEQFLQDWMKFGSDERIITDMPNVCGKENLPEFIEHRWDQSVLSLLAYKRDITLFRMPSQFGNHYKAPAYRIKNEFNCVNQLKQRQVKFYAKEPYDNSPYGQLLDHHRSKSNGHNHPASSEGIIKNLIYKIRHKFK